VYSCSVLFALNNNSLLLQLPGVDPNDPSVKDLLASMQNQSEVSLSTMEKDTFDLKEIVLEDFCAGIVTVLGLL